MMKKLYYLIASIVAAGVMYSCDNGYADSDLLDSPPEITLEGVPSAVGEGFPIEFTATLQDGISEEHSQTPLQNYAFSLVDPETSDEISSGGGQVSGRDAVVDVSVPTVGAVEGSYELIFSATDIGGNTSTETVMVDIGPYSIGIVGSAIGSWDNDLNMNQSPTDPTVWTLTITASDGEAKFRLNDGWDTNWGAADFPTGVGVQEGENIPVPAGTYDVTFNSSTGEYSFE